MVKRGLAIAVAIGTSVAGLVTASEQTETGYVSVNGLEMHYETHGSGPHETHGSGPPLVLLHGALMTIEGFGEVLPSLAESRQVIAIEQQAHGRTADVDRPFSYEQMADDTAALLGQLGIEEADFFGYSMGGGIALAMAMRHPELVRKLVVAAAAYSNDGVYPEVLQGIEKLKPEDFAGSPWLEAYASVAPDPDDWPTLLAKVQQMDHEFEGWPPEAISSIEAPALIIVGDADIVRPEHAVEMLRLLGGGVPGDLGGLPRSQLAVLPGTTHVTLVDRADWLTSMITAFSTTRCPSPSDPEADTIMSLKLYFHPLASFCHKALIGLYENGTPFEPVIVDLMDEASSAAFRAVWPMAKMPVLRDEARDRTVAESTIVVEYLDTYYPGTTRFVPADPDRAWQTRMWDRFCDSYLQQPMQRIVTDRLRPAGMNDAFGVEQARTELREAYGVLEEKVGAKTWMLGDAFTLADCAAAPALFYADTVVPFGETQDRLRAYLGRLMARPSFARVLKKAEPYFKLFPLEPKPRIAREDQ